MFDGKGRECAIDTDSEISFSRPNATSSPHRRQQSSSESPTAASDDNGLVTLVVNCRSIKSPGKKAIVQNMIDATQADIVIGTESWLDDSI
ncbi:hypothetical protein DPMN_166321 [Dreissena polymorpha]|uniref:Uncharacterized protein n=1 Tax=Dreissena polymorpha TaxID=45954 RepID=A0A9D4EZ99_DREPO|nr:hypothetical protein DPMN_166321 [Dreissena polymorpha]